MESSTFGRFHHAGVAVHRIDEAMGFLRAALGATEEGQKVHDPEQGVHIQFMMAGGLRIELLEPASNPSPLDGILKRGIGLYHVGYEVDELDERLASMCAAGAAVVSPPKSAVAFGGRRVAFLMWKGSMIELIEGTSNSAAKLSAS